jgi:hypothetical protein
LIPNGCVTPEVTRYDCSAILAGWARTDKLAHVFAPSGVKEET